MTIIRKRTVVRSLPNAAVGRGAISFASGPTGSVALGPCTFIAGPTGSVALGSGTFTSGPTGSIVLGGSGTFASGPTGSVALGSGTFTSGPTGSIVLGGSGTFTAGPAGCVVLTGGSLPDAPDWASTAYLFKAPLSSSEPVISQWELFDNYRELGEAFGQIAELDEDDDSWIEAPVLNIARNVAVELMISAFPVPQIFNHGPKSLVFNWINGRDNLYLTVSARNVSILVSTPQTIKRRVEYPVDEFLKHEHTVPLLQLAYSEQQATITVSGTSQ
jgi:hypothetical protein